MEIISLINQKGGVGKSTSAYAIGVGLSRRGLKVLLIDLDAQGNMSHTAGVSTTGISAFNLLTGEATANEAIQQTTTGIDIIPSSPLLANADTVIIKTGKDYRLKEALAPIKKRKQYDFIVIDTPPALGIVTINALTACTGCIVPAHATEYCLHGISQFYETLDAIHKYNNPALAVYGILLTRYNPRTIIGREVANTIKKATKDLKTKLFDAKIRECIAVHESQTVQEDIFSYSPKSNVSMDYTAFLDEFLTDIKRKERKK